MRDLTKLNSAGLAAALDTPNGTERDRVQIELLSRGRSDGAATEVLQKLAVTAAPPQVRVSALSALDARGAFPPTVLLAALRDSSPNVRQQALRLCETNLRDKAIADQLPATATDPSPLVRRQLAFTLGEWNDPRAGELLASLAKSAGDDADLRLAILSSANRFPGEILEAVLSADLLQHTRDAWVPPLVATLSASDNPKSLQRALALVLPLADAAPSAGQFAALPVCSTSWR